MKYSYFFKDQDIKDDLAMEFISLWQGWLGKENYHKLDEVSQKD